VVDAVGIRFPRKRWLVAQHQDERSLGASLGVHPVLARILAGRGITDAAQAAAFLHGELPGKTDPFQMRGIPLAVEHAMRALAAREPIVVYGDYDADGVTATALLVRFLNLLGANVRGYIPSRFEEGYGLNPGAIRQLAAEGARLIITVDCGVRSFAEADVCRELGISLVITDHHQPLGNVPEAAAVVNPKQPGDDSSEKNLAGVGLAYRLAEAISVRVGQSARNTAFLEDALELVAVGTVADLAPLIGENRMLVRRGLSRMNSSGPHNPGLRALAQAAKVTPGSVRGHTIGFVIGPRLNAAGRLETARAALDLLLTDDSHVALDLAHQLDSWNRRRQDETRSTFEHARDKVLGLRAPLPANAGPYFLLVAHESYSSGIIGLAASRLTEEFYRPSAVVALEGEEVRGSARSIPAFHVTGALDACRDLLIRHGGHAAAAGFTIARANLPELARRLESLAQAELGHAPLEPTLAVDAEVRLGELAGLNDALPGLEPCGMGNPTPVFVARGLTIREKRRVGSDGSHLKLRVEQDGRRMNAIAFRWGEAAEALPARVDAAFQLTVNEYMGERRDELHIVDLAPSKNARAAAPA
jgi:single-stranded-DNA-specific exonuclease